MILYVLGNGFTIDLIKKLTDSNLLNKNSIDLKNLFSKGNDFSLGTCDGYLSSNHCKCLSKLGVSTALKDDAAISFISNTVTSFNVYCNWRNNNKNHYIYHPKIGNQYIQAYDELNMYLKRLFIYYNSLITDDMLNKLIKSNQISLLSHIKEALRKDDSVKVITYNYDIFLERILSLSKIPFNLIGFNYDPDILVSVYKPHGSINFSCRCQLNKNSLYERLNISMDKLYIDKQLKLENSFSALVAPFGDAYQNLTGWTTYLREEIKKIIISPSSDKVIIFGHSYNDIDRPEIDQILVKIPESTKIAYINPYPSDTFKYVLYTIFESPIISDVLEKEIV